MAKHEVFGSNGVVVLVSDEELNAALGQPAPLPTQIINAAAKSGRKDLAEKIRLSLCAPVRSQKLAAAKALFVLDYKSAAPDLLALSQKETDQVVSNTFSAVHLALTGTENAVKYFLNPNSDPNTASRLILNYNSYIHLRIEDLEFLAIALTEYHTRSLPWLKNYNEEHWNGDLLVMIAALSKSDAVERLLKPESSLMRETILQALTALLAMSIDKELRKDIKTLQRKLHG